jgi:hypothetical protein
MCIQHAFPNNSFDVVYLALSFIQKWRILMRRSEKAMVESMVKKMQEFVGGLQLTNNLLPDGALSDVGFL